LDFVVRRQNDQWLDDERRQSPFKGTGRGRAEPAQIRALYAGAYAEVGRLRVEDGLKISPKCNSGIFVRTSTLQTRPNKDVGYNGIEIAIDDTTTAGFVDTGAFYDLSKPKKNAMKPVGEWNHIEITSKGPILEVELNGEKINRLNLDEWTDANKRPDGTPHKFETVWKDHPRVGYIGLQDHGSPVWFKNIKIKPL
jgi:hypothetical protein